jgi:hypothetical protein
MAAQFVGLALAVGLSGPPPLARRSRFLGEALRGCVLAYLVLAGTRSVGLALGAAILVLARLGRLQAGTVLRPAAAAALVVALVEVVAPGAAGTVPEGSKATSAGMRLAVWQDSLILVRDHPLGVGAGNFEHAFMPYALTGRSRPGEGLVFRSPHNDYLRFVAEEGIPASLFLLLLGLLLLRELNRSTVMGRWRSEAGAFLAGTGTFLAVEAFFQFPFEMAASALVAAILLGLALSAAGGPALDPPQTAAGTTRGRVACLGLAVLLVAGTLRTATAERLAAQRDASSVERACRLDPRRLDACVERAWLDSREGHHTTVQERLRRILEASPAYLPALKLRAEDLLASGRRDEGCAAARDYDRLLQGRSSLRGTLLAQCEGRSLEGHMHAPLERGAWSSRSGPRTTRVRAGFRYSPR